MKKTSLLLALSVVAVPLVAQQYNYYNSAEESESLAERNARRARLAVQAAEQQRQAGDDIYRGKVFGAEQQSYASTTLGERTPAKTKYVYDTSLIRAIKMGDEDRVRTLLYANVDPNERNYANITPLTMAAEKGNLIIVKYLVQAKADVNATSPYGVTPLIAAASQGHSDIVEYLLAHGANASVKDETGKTPLLYASNFDNEKLITALAKASPASVNIADDAGNTPLIYAAQKGNSHNVKALLANQADPNYRNPATGVGALAVAAAEGNEDIIRSLTKYQADLNLPDLQGRAPLAYATETGKAGAVRALLSAGANPNVQDLNGVTPLMRAAAKGDTNCSSILTRRPDIDLEEKDVQGRTALIYTAYAPTANVTAQLIKRGANMNATDHAGNTALSTALTLKNEAVANYLIEQGADTVRANTLAVAQQYMPASSATQKIAGETDRAYQEALQQEAASLAQVRELEAQLMQDEARVEQLRAQHKADAQEFISDLQTQYEQTVEEAELAPTVLQEEASEAQQEAAAHAQALRNQVTAEKEAWEKSARAAQEKQMTQAEQTVTRTKNTGKKQTAATQKKAKGIIQDMPVLQPRLRSMADE